MGGEMSPDVATCPWGDKITSGWAPLLAVGAPHWTAHQGPGFLLRRGETALSADPIFSQDLRNDPEKAPPCGSRTNVIEISPVEILTLV